MNVYRLPHEVRSELKHEPEYFMGAQKVSARLPNGSHETGWVIDGRLFLSDDDKLAAERNGQGYQLFRLAMMSANLDDALNRQIEAANFVTVRSVIPRWAESLKGVRKIHGSGVSGARLHTLSIPHRESLSAKSGAAVAAPVTQSEADEIFKRFSAYKDDNRVTERRALTKGTFATTAEDAVNVRTGAEAVVRYALPNKVPANQVFTIAPPGRTDLKRGVAQPAYGEPGGGVEVIFVDGSPDGTVYGPKEIPAT